ncbi:MAG: lysophospholipase [Lachnospiraceae bacterium]|nr:lysophospholipase [Lachnospiraceae bacterium]
MAKVTEYSFNSADDRHTKIHAVKWEPEEGSPLGVVQLIHGMIEYIERYSDFAEYLTGLGFIVMGHDHIGHGDSVSSSDEWGIMHAAFPDYVMVEDIYSNYKLIRKQYPALPHFILGHSMGSYMLRMFLAEKSDDLYDLSGAVIMGTGTSPDNVTSMGLKVVNFLSRIFGRNHKSKFVEGLMFGGGPYKKFNTSGEDPENSWLTKDVDIVKRYYNEPKCRFAFSLGAYKGLISAVYYDNQLSNVSKIQKQLPVFFVSGTDDPVGDFGVGVKTAYSLFKKAGITDVTMKLYDGDRHEILNETDREKVYSDIGDWMIKYCEEKKK